MTVVNSKQLLVKAILEHSGDFEWSLQGFGMLRLYLAPEVRLHVWDSRYRVEDVTDMHTHPWHFHSEIIVGEVVNKRYTKIRNPVKNCPRRWVEKEILCGEGGHEIGHEHRVALIENVPETFVAGQVYSQLAHEIHFSVPVDGSVTIITREFLDDADHAFVYVLDGTEWVSAEPRLATPDEVSLITKQALECWFD